MKSLFLIPIFLFFGSFLLLKDGGDSTITEKVTASQFCDAPAIIPDSHAAVSGYRYNALVAGGDMEEKNFPNGTFEYGPKNTSWNFANGTGFAANNSAFTKLNPNAPSGNTVLFIQGNRFSKVGNKFTTNQSVSYVRLQFFVAQRKNNNQRLRIFIDGYNVGEITPKGSDYEVYKTAVIAVQKGVHTLQIAGVLTGNTAFVDDVRIQHFRKWSDKNTWVNKKVPNADANVALSNIGRVVLDGQHIAASVLVEGELVTPINKEGIALQTKWILVRGKHGLFEIGQPSSRQKGKVTITLLGKETDPDIGTMGSKFIVAMDQGKINFHGKKTTSWTQLNQTATKGQSSIKLKEPGRGWEEGDEILLVTTSYNHHQNEVRKIQRMSSDKKTVFLDKPLSYTHNGQTKTYATKEKSWTADLRGEVGLLTHSIKIQGDVYSETNGFGGHMMIHNNGVAHVSQVELYRMGQKSKLARYPFHWHLLVDKGRGQYFEDSSVHKSYNRAITIHGTHYTKVNMNVFFDHIGHGVFLEDGSEMYNWISYNLTVATKRPKKGEEVTPSDNQFDKIQNRSPASYWITNPDNFFDNNVAAGTVGTGYWFIFPETVLGASKYVPELKDIIPFKQMLGSFNRNKAHSCRSGFDIFDQLEEKEESKPMIVTNLGWQNEYRRDFIDCTWYANDLGVYAGLGNLKGVFYDIRYKNNTYFKDNIFVDNNLSAMFASDIQVSGSLFVASSGLGLNTSPQKHLYRTYDGPGSVTDSHFVGYTSSENNFLKNGSAAFKHVNHHFEGNTTASGTPPYLELPNYDLPPAPITSEIDFRHPKQWIMVLRDADGMISQTGKLHSIISNHPMLRSGKEKTTPFMKNAYYTPDLFALTFTHFPSIDKSEQPGIIVKRKKLGTKTETHYNFFKSQHNPYRYVPTIVNDGYLYEYQIEQPVEVVNQFMFFFENARYQDKNLQVFKGFGGLRGLRVNQRPSNGSNQFRPLQKSSSLSALKKATRSSYYDDGKDLYLRLVFINSRNQYNIIWTGGTPDYITAPPANLNNQNITKSFDEPRQYDSESWSLYPNPITFDKEFTVEIPSLHESEINMTLYDLYGKRIVSKVIFLNNGRSAVKLNLKTIPQGTYFVKLQSNQNTYSKMIRIQ